MATKSKIILDDDQQFALMKFRRNVRDLLQPNHNDAYLLRWLRARDWNVEAAEKMFKQSMDWRKQWEVDGALKEWKPAEVVSKYVPSGIAGFDRDGCPVYIVPIKGLDIVGMLHSVPQQELIKFTIQVIEVIIASAAKSNNTQCVLVFDLEEFALRPYAWRPATEVVISLLQIYEANYPEILKVCYVINTPRVFSIAFNVIKRFLNDYTIAKIKIYKSDRKKWEAAMKEYVDDDQLPKHYGGTMVDPDGDPTCPSKVKPGGKVPKSYYKKNITSVPTDREQVQTTVKKGSKISMDFIVAEEGCFLKWEFNTDGHDIKFGVSCKDEEGNVTPAIRAKRVAAHQVEQSGVMACKAPATYTVTFDNSYSLFKSKKISYSVYVTEPISSLEVTMLPKNDVQEEENHNGKL